MTKVRAVRKLKGLSQEEIADEIGIDQKTYGNWENGKTDLTFNNLGRIAKALKVPVETFWDEKQFTTKGEFGNPDIKFTAEPPIKFAASDELNFYKRRVEELQEVNLALSRSINRIFDQDSFVKKEGVTSKA